MAVRLKAKVDGVERVTRNLRGMRKQARIVSGRVLMYWGDQIRNGIKRDRTLFRYAVSPIRGSGRRRGALKQSLWKSRSPKKDKRGNLMVELGWGVPYGEVMEHGPERAKTWSIKPTGFRSDTTHGRSGAGVDLKFLRFRGRGGKICYAREVTRRWKQSELRPHFEPHTEFRVKMLQKDMTRQLAKAFDSGR